MQVWTLLIQILIWFKVTQFSTCKRALEANYITLQDLQP